MGALVDYYRCPPDLAPIGTRHDLSIQDGFFKFGDAIAFGRVAGEQPARYASDPLRNVADDDVTITGGKAWLPFDLSEVATNLREERYRQNGYNFLQKSTTRSAVQRLYYQFRPLMGIGVRKHLQKVRLTGWDKIPFPRWPVDRSVDALMESAMTLALKAQGRSQHSLHLVLAGRGAGLRDDDARRRGPDRHRLLRRADGHRRFTSASSPRSSSFRRVVKRNGGGRRRSCEREVSKSTCTT